MIDFTQETYLSLRRRCWTGCPILMTSGTRPPSPRPSPRRPTPWRGSISAWIRYSGRPSADSSGGFPGYAGCDWRPDPISGLRRGTPGRVQYLCARWSTGSPPSTERAQSDLTVDGGNRYGEPGPSLPRRPPAPSETSTPGRSCRLPAIAGLTSAQITDILVPGQDTRPTSAFRERLIKALNNRTFGGNIADTARTSSPLTAWAGCRYTPPGAAVAL